MANLDDKDWNIINILKENGDYTTRQIAKRVFLPITTVHHRIKKLKKEGFIKKYTIELDPVKVEKTFVAYLLISVNLELLKSNKKTQQDLAKEIRMLDCVERADIVSGNTDIIAIIRLKNVEEYDKLLLGRIQQLEGIKRTQSMIVIH